MKAFFTYSIITTPFVPYWIWYTRFDCWFIKSLKMNHSISYLLDFSCNASGNTLKNNFPELLCFLMDGTATKLIETKKKQARYNNRVSLNDCPIKLKLKMCRFMIVVDRTRWQLLIVRNWENYHYLLEINKWLAKNLLPT